MKLPALMFTTLIAGILATECEQPLVYCLSESTYSLNVTIFGTLFDFGIVLNCPEGYYCHEATNMPCQVNPPITTTVEPPTTTEDTTTEDATTENTTTELRTTPLSSTTTSMTTSTTTTPKPTEVLPPTCKQEGYHQANACNQYYECIRALWYFDVKLKTCKSGYYYSSKNPPCDKPPNVVCSN